MIEIENRGNEDGHTVLKFFMTKGGNTISAGVFGSIVGKENFSSSRDFEKSYRFIREVLGPLSI